MASSQNPGKKLFFSQFGGEQSIPPEFIAAMERKEEVQSVNNEVEPEELSDTIVESSVKTDRTNERVRRTIKKKEGNVGPLNFIHTNDQGRPVQAARLLYPTGSPLSTVPNAYTTVAVQDLGNGWSIEEVGVEGTYVGVPPVFVPGVFAGPLYRAEGPKLTPEEFRATTPELTTREDSAGIAVFPTLVGDEVSETQEQITATKKRTTTVAQPFPTLPKVLDKGRDTNQAKQDVTVIRTLDLESATPPIATALKDVQIKQLGDGTKVIEERNVASVFGANVFERSRPNLTPEEFRSAIPDVTTQVESAGTAVDPTLSGAELVETQTQLTTQTKRVRVTSQAAPTLPAVLDQGRQTNQVQQNVTVTRTLMTDGTAAETPTILKDVEVKQLGDGNKVQETRVVASLHAASVFSRSRPNLTPEEFRPSIPKVTSRVDSSGIAVDPTLTGTELEETQEQVTDLKKRITIVTQAAPSLPIALSAGRDTNAAKQDVTIVRTLMTVLTSPETATATKDVQIKELGDGNKVQETRTVASVFSNDVFRRSRPNLTPEEFRPAIPTVTVVTESSGTAVDPTLSGTELEEEQSQITALTKRIAVTTQAAPSLPVTLDKGKDTNNDDQDVTVTRQLVTDATLAPTTTALKSVQIKQLGDGNKVIETREVASVATHNLFSRERPNLTPERFRPSIPTIVTRVDSSGTAVDPTLAGTELSETQEQITELKKRITIATQAAPSLPISLGGREMNADKQLVTVVDTLQTVGSAITTPTALIDVSLQNLGDGNVIHTTKTRPLVLDKTVFEAKVPEFIPERFRQTSDVETTTVHEIIGTASAPSLTVSSGDLMKREEQLDTFVKRTTAINRPNNGFPILDGHVYNKELDIIEAFTESIQNAGANASTARSEVTPLNDNLDLVKTLNITAIQTALDAYSKTFVGTTNIDFPAQLNSVSGLLEQVQGAAGLYEQSGGWGIAGNGSASMNLRGSANGGAGIMPDVIIDIQQTWGANVPCTHLLFFVASGTSRAAILSRIATIMGLTVGSTLFDWPVFVPKAVTIICHGEHVSGQASVDVQRTSVAQFDYNGDPSGHTGESGCTGHGQSYDVAITTKSVRIPPTIHAQMDITNDSTFVTFSALATIDAGVGTGGFATIPVSGQANGYIKASNSITQPLRIFATPGASQIPFANYYLYRLSSEPHNEGDRIRVHAEVVHFDGNRSVVP